MENVCHTLVGGVLARAGLDRLSPLATPTMLVAANLPDVDVVSTLWGDLAYLEHHRGITHSVLGLLAQAPLLAGAACVWDRLVRRRRDPAAPRARFVGLLVVSLVGLASHLLLDYTNSYGVKPWLPFDATWYYGDLVFIVDPWMWLLLGGPLFLTARRGRATGLFWGAVFAAMATSVAFSARLAPAAAGGAAVVFIWMAALAVIVVARVGWPPPDARRAALVSLAGVLAYWLLLAGLHRAALTSVDAAEPGAKAATPTLMRPDRWTTFVLERGVIRVGEVRLGEGPIAVHGVARNLDDAAVVAALSTCPGRVAASFNRFLYADVAEAGAGRRVVSLRDARFGSLPGPYTFATTNVTLDADLRAEPDARPCPRLGASW